MHHSEHVDELFKALAAAQADIKSPTKNREVEVYSKRTNSKYKFKYATLDNIIECVRPALTANGLWFTQTTDMVDGKYRLMTTVTHASGQYIQSETPLIVDGQSNQEFGGALSYARRYALSAMLGIAADDDDDANAADGNEIQSMADKPAEQMTPTEKKKAGLWQGPLQVTALKNKMRDLSAALKAAESQDFIHDLTSNEFAEVLEQCAVDLPDWYEKAEQAIQAALKGLPEHADPVVHEFTVPVTSVENGSGADWETWVEAVDNLLQSNETPDSVMNANAAPLDNLKKANQTLHDWICSQANNRKYELEG